MVAQDIDPGLRFRIITYDALNVVMSDYSQTGNDTVTVEQLLWNSLDLPGTVISKAWTLEMDPFVDDPVRTLTAAQRAQMNDPYDPVPQ